MIIPRGVREKTEAAAAPIKQNKPKTLGATTNDSKHDAKNKGA